MCNGANIKNLEARVILQATELAIQQGWNEVTIESDAQHVVKILNGKEPNADWELKNVVTDFLELAERIPTIQ